MEETINPKDKIGITKQPMTVLPTAGIRLGANAAQHGADKYGPYNWREFPIAYLVYLDAMLRHIYALLDREDTDPDSGVHHLGHVIAGASILADAIEHGMVKDDRPQNKISS